jgi:hypothetical protein
MADKVSTSDNSVSTTKDTIVLNIPEMLGVQDKVVVETPPSSPIRHQDGLPYPEFDHHTRMVLMVKDMKKIMRQIPSLQQDEELAYMYSEMESNLIKMAN